MKTGHLDIQLAILTAETGRLEQAVARFFRGPETPGPGDDDARERRRREAIAALRGGRREVD